MDWTEVEQRVSEDDRNKWDRKTPATALRIVDDGGVELTDHGGSERFALAQLATTQMCQRLGIPVAYYRRLPDQLRARVANYDLERLKDNAFLLRGKNEWVRAFLSSDYVAY